MVLKNVHSQLVYQGSLGDCCMICFDDESPDLIAMPCKPVKHMCCPDCLMQYCWSELGNDRLKTVIACSLCSTEWDLGVIKRYAGASNEEIALLSENLPENVIRTDPNIMECPSCGSYCEQRYKKCKSMHHIASCLMLAYEGI